jgi:hypothetical protein
MKQPNLIIQIFFCAMLVLATWEGLKYEYRQNKEEGYSTTIDPVVLQTMAEYGDIPRLSVDDLEYFNPNP